MATTEIRTILKLTSQQRQLLTELVNRGITAGVPIDASAFAPTQRALIWSLCDGGWLDRNQARRRTLDSYVMTARAVAAVTPAMTRQQMMTSIDWDWQQAAELLGEVQAVMRTLTDAEQALLATTRHAADLDRDARTAGVPDAEIDRRRLELAQQVDRIASGINGNLTRLWEDTADVRHAA